MAAPVSLTITGPATAAVRPNRHFCVFAPCGYYLGWGEPACPKHRKLLPLADRKVLKGAWQSGRGAASAEWLAALEAAESHLSKGDS